MKIENSRRNFIPRNDPFICAKCDANVPPAPQTFRNHCPHCLTSKHVDGRVPGDRSASCHGLMPTISYEGTDPTKLDLIQECEVCGLVRRNKMAPDDSLETLLQNQNLPH